MQSLTEKFRPRSIEDFLGLDKAKKICRRLCDNPFASAWLFIGEPGLGKTTLALALADSMPAELHHISIAGLQFRDVAHCHRALSLCPADGLPHAPGLSR
jgi:replication-associated recombination protein RarA